MTGGGGGGEGGGDQVTALAVSITAGWMSAAGAGSSLGPRVFGVAALGSGIRRIGRYVCLVLLVDLYRCFAFF